MCVHGELLTHPLTSLAAWIVLWLSESFKTGESCDRWKLMDELILYTVHVRATYPTDHATPETLPELSNDAISFASPGHSSVIAEPISPTQEEILSCASLRIRRVFGMVSGPLLPFKL